MKPIAPDTSFKFFPQLNEIDNTSCLRSKYSFNSDHYETFFKDDTLQSKLLYAIAQAQFLPIKEILESFEFFACIRRKVKAEVMCDLCCGHGLLGLLFAIFERKVSKVYLVDRHEPESRQRLINACLKVAPWIENKIHSVSDMISPESEWLEDGMSVLGIHACGILTDLCIDIGITTGGHIAIMPCCYPEKKCPAPLSLQENLGFETAFDVHRTYNLENAGYHVNWHSIPSSITPMNRVIIARK